ncbi:CRISPR type I-E/ECOLI-associated protein CasA/Cse1 [Raoultella terrigena]|nr:CRISPR type I-E/ECOLI-associated protein CasA/Cse1 [Raoultella terrigena]
MFPENLIVTPWLPVRFKDGSTGKLAPVDLADESVVDIAATRADLQGQPGSFCWGYCSAALRPKIIIDGKISGKRG